ncbi:DUF6126 family protein [Streptomyces sp. NPDC050161]|uniref:DUF6126 family protein n=1 Tax=Streptomyces sp. NPDC050161 TaxID=3365604 RepID=UPI0037A2B09A
MPDHSTPPPALPEPGAGAAPDAVPDPAAPARVYVENKPPRGLYVRVFIYVVATHVLLAFMSLLVIIAKTR